MELSFVRQGRAGIALLAGLAIAACAPAEAAPPAPATPTASPARPAAVPVELLASVSLGPASTLRGLQAYLDAIKPGIGATLSEQVVRRQLASALGVPSLDGLDPSPWLTVMISDANGTPTVSVLGKVGDAKRLTAAVGADHVTSKNGWAVIGGKPQLDRLAPYAFGVLAGQATPRAPTATVYVPQVLTRYQPQLALVKTQMLGVLAQSQGASGPMAKLMTSYLEGLASIGDDTLQVIITLDAAPELAALDFALVPRGKSRLAEFTAAQKPTDFALLDKLPALTPAVLLGGRLDLGPYHEGFLTLMATFFDPSASKDLIAAFEQVRKAMTGEVAMAFQLAPGSGLQMVQLTGTDDAKLASQGIGRVLDLFKAGRTMAIEGVATTIKALPQTTTYDGVTLRGYDTTYDLSKASPAQRDIHKKLAPNDVQHAQVATFDAVTLIAASADAAGDARKAIDASRGKPGAARFTASGLTRDQLAASRARKDSMALVFDLGRMIPAFAARATAVSAPIVMSFGAPDHNAHVRLAVPAETLHAAAGMAP
ncbi:MAG TPA: hypothetical protein VFP84_00235 [Kofleriaceae bacterium]|nr:hypothetical protein [Kofleriaceae bacterium]